jgi:hypothetical protein
MKVYGGVETYLHRSLPQLQMEVHGQFHTPPSSLSGLEIQVPIGQEAGWSRCFGGVKNLFPARNQTLVIKPCPIALATDLSWLPKSLLAVLSIILAVVHLCHMEGRPKHNLHMHM